MPFQHFRDSLEKKITFLIYYTFADQMFKYTVSSTFWPEVAYYKLFSTRPILKSDYTLISALMGLKMDFHCFTWNAYCPGPYRPRGMKYQHIRNGGFEFRVYCKAFEIISARYRTMSFIEHMHLKGKMKVFMIP